MHFERMKSVYFPITPPPSPKSKPRRVGGLSRAFPGAPILLWSKARALRRSDRNVGAERASQAASTQLLNNTFHIGAGGVGVQLYNIYKTDGVKIDNDTIYGECLARLTATRGRLFLTLTPLLGLSPIRKRFKERIGKECETID